MTTNLLDFLEQALEKVDLNQLISQAKSRTETTQEPQTPEELEMSSMSIIANRDNQLSNFPVDIIVYCNVMPSTIRFRYVLGSFWFKFLDVFALLLCCFQCVICLQYSSL